jgi:hypothetical protein
MAPNPRQEAKYAIMSIQFKSIARFKRTHRLVHGVCEDISQGIIHTWCHMFEATGSIMKTRCDGRKRDAEVEIEFDNYIGMPQKFTRHENGKQMYLISPAKAV